jgi:hypothetical protein
MGIQNLAPVERLGIQVKSFVEDNYRNLNRLLMVICLWFENNLFFE